MNKSDIVKYGEELLRTGSLSWRRNSSKYKDRLRFDFYMEWPPHSDVFTYMDSGEEIIYASSKKDNYKSVHHFAWTILLFQREIDNKIDIREVVEDSVLVELTIDESLEKINQYSSEWLKRYQHLIPDSIKCFIIVNLDLDIFIVFETNEKYFGWEWSSSA
jgi:hypothetical protein